MPRLKLDPLSPSGVSPVAEVTTVKQSNGYVTNNIRGLITAGNNVTLTGSGTESNPYQIAAGDMDTAATWGNITGTLSSQTDLTTALGNYVPNAGGTMTGLLTSTFNDLAQNHTRLGKSVSYGLDGNTNFALYNNTDATRMLTILNNGSGFHLGTTSTPGYLRGTGFPNGVVSAPVGSIYIDTAITNGASSWIKKSGTGNTGWQVLEGASQNTFATNSGTAALRVQRSGRTLFYSFEGTLGATVTNPILTIPDGYRPHATFSFLYGNGGAPYSKIATILTNGEVSLYSAPTASATIAGTGSTMASATYPTI